MVEVLPAGSITSWDELPNAFLDHYFLPSKMLQLHDKIINFYEINEEPLQEVFE